MVRAVALALGIASPTVWNVQQKKETTGALITRHHTGLPRKTIVYDKHIDSCDEKLNQQSVTSS